jgi:hypothetical protein
MPVTRKNGGVVVYRLPLYMDDVDGLEQFDLTWDDWEEVKALVEEVRESSLCPVRRQHSVRQ